MGGVRVRVGIRDRGGVRVRVRVRVMGGGMGSCGTYC